jgi:predicted DNA-binding transcriptional regulator AlpA
MNDEAILERLDLLIAATRQAAQPDPWIDAQSVAAYLTVSVDHTRQRIVCLPDFPRALRVNGGQPRWLRSEVEQWALAHRVRKGKPGRPRKAA